MEILYVKLSFVATPNAVLDEPDINYINSTTMIVSYYSPPWYHPINQYCITVTNTTSSDTIIVHCLASNSFTLSQDSFTGCHNLSLSAEAYTDLGNFSSAIVNTSFPKGMISIFNTYGVITYYSTHACTSIKSATERFQDTIPFLAYTV